MSPVKSQPVLQATRLSKRYRRRQVVNEVSFHVNAGEIVGLLGPNGAGKTTSFNMVAGLVQSDAGQVRLGSIYLGGLPLWRRVRAGLGYLPQESTVLRGLSCRHNLWVALEAQGLVGEDRDVRTQQTLEQYRLEHVAEVDGAQLSGGERRRLELARALLREPRVLLLDEPFAGVDPIAVADIKEAIRQVRDHGIGVLVTDHNVTETLRLCDRAYLIYDGRIVAEGVPQEIVDNPLAQRVYLGRDFSL